MGITRVDLNISLDGYATTTDQTPEDPFGRDWARLTAAYTATRSWRAKALGAADGTTGVDDRYAAEEVEGIGAVIMGAGMFGLHAYPDDPDWRGWWGPNPPFHVPVFVLTHRDRPTLEMEGGTTFSFLRTDPHDALERARASAGDQDVRIAGGVSVVRDFLAADLVDQLHVGIAPILLGRGGSLWTGLRGLEQTHEVRSEIDGDSGTIHVTFKRPARGGRPHAAIVAEA